MKREILLGLMLASLGASQEGAQTPVPNVASALPVTDSVRADSARTSLAAQDSSHAVPKTDSAVKTVDSALAKDTVHRGPKLPLTVRSTAPQGAIVSVAGIETHPDSSGKWFITTLVDSSVRASGSVELCLQVGQNRACSPLRLQGFDTLEIAPLVMKIDTVVETHDTVVTRDSTTDSLLAARQGRAGDAQKVEGAGASKTVVVRGKRRAPRQMGQERVSVKTIKQMPGLAEPDVIRAVQALPGVVQSSDFSTKIYVRGSSSDQNLVLFDNAVVYSPSHFGGLFSSFLADATGGLDFYKGGFESRYGNRLASVLNVSSKTGGVDPDSGKPTSTWFKGMARLTTFGGSAEVEGHQGDFSWVYAGRRTWIGEALKVAKSAGITDIDIGYYFYDQQGSVVWGNKDGDSVRVSIYQGRDSLTISPIGLDWGNLAVPLNVRKRIVPGLAYRGSLSWSDFDQTFAIANFLKATNGVKTLSTRQELVWDAPDGHQLTGGYEYNDYRVRFGFAFPLLGSNDSDDPTTSVHAAYFQDRWVINPRWTVTAGLRGYYCAADDDISFDPRATVTWRPAPNWKTDFHWGLYHQYLTSLRFSSQEMPNEYWYPVRGDLKPTWQSLLAAGVERTNLTPWDLRLTVEGYYKNIRNYLIYYPHKTASQQEKDYLNSDLGMANDMTTARGWAMGGEVAVSKEEGPLTATLSYGLGWSVLKQDPYSNSLDTLRFGANWTDWDQRNTFKLSLTSTWLGDGKNSLWKTGRKNFYFRSTLQANFNTGLPYTGYDGYTATHLLGQGAEGVNEAPENQYVIQGGLNNERKPNYFRLDLTLFDIGKTNSWRTYFTVINLTDHDNVYTVNYNGNEAPPKKTTTYQFPRLPVFLGAEVEF